MKIQSLIIKFLILLVLFLVTIQVTIQSKEHECKVPCTVQLPQGTQEDDFKFDYRGNYTLYVTTKEKGHP